MNRLEERKEEQLLARIWRCVATATAIFLAISVTYGLIQVTTCCSFHTPTESMTPNILPGDYGIVNKWRLGGRIFNLLDAMKGRRFKVYRLPGYGKVERNDVVIFNYPMIGKDSVGINMHTYYCKRIVAVPGDTLEIADCHYRVRGVDEVPGYKQAQDGLAQMFKYSDEPERYICAKTWPYDSIMEWTVKDFGPLFIPRKGSTVELTRETTLLYRLYIAWEMECEPPVWQDGCARIGGKPIKHYTFKENYYFTAGDNAYNSADSRYWGLLPEPMIVGVSTLIWDSVNHDSDKRRWDRVLTRIKH